MSAVPRRSSEESPVLRPATLDSDRPLVSFGLHIPALVLVFELEAEPQFFSTHAPEDAREVADWLASAHPEWADVLLRATAIAGAALEEEDET